MKIALDFRGLLTGKISGVENYTFNILERLLQQDRENQYKILENAFRSKDLSHLRFINTEIVQKRWPNKVFNGLLKFFKYPKFEQYFGDFDLLFMPNFNFFAIAPQTKLIVTVHDMSPVLTPEHYNLKRRLWHRLVDFKGTLKRADRIVAVSEYTKNDLIRLFDLPEEKVTVIYPGIDHHMFRPDLSEDKLREVRNIYSLPGDYILFLNTVEPRKNLVNFIRAFEKIDSPASLVIGGKKGWKYGPIFSAIENSPKRHKIKYLGYIPEDHKPYIIKLAKAVGFPSFYEGFGFPALEALSVGTPVLASQVTSLPETVEDAALMVDPYNIDDMASGLQQLLVDHELRNILRTKGFAQAAKFNWDAAAAKMLTLFKSI
jgi:glycosyltransferase involved in cell wall biosynthesis